MDNNANRGHVFQREGDYPQHLALRPEAISDAGRTRLIGVTDQEVALCSVQLSWVLMVVGFGWSWV